VILVDTSVWVGHLRTGDTRLRRLLNEGQVLCHPFVIGELSCGHLRNRGELVALLRALPEANVVEHEEALVFVEHHRLGGAGIGWVDVHLLASAVLARASLWTLDLPLVRAAHRLGIGL
jgi:predicted nucleic acid-binding protein